MAETEACSDSQPVCHIHDLPDEILLQVFLLIKPQHLMVTTISLVCSRWHSLHSDPCLYKNIVLTYNYPITSVAVDMVQMATWLSTLQISNRSDVDEILQHVGMNTPRIEKLIITNCTGYPRMESVSARHLHNILEHCPDIQTLTLKDTFCADISFYNDIGLSLFSLRHIDFGNTLDVSPEGLRNIADNCHHFVELRLRSHAFYITEALIHFCTRFSESLRVLKTCCLFLNNTVLPSIAGCVKLTVLSLDRSHRINNSCLMTISNLPNLEELRIKYAHKVTSECWARFFGTEQMQKIRKLSLNCRNVDGEVLRVIGGMVHLTDLSVQDANEVSLQCWVDFFIIPHIQQNMTRLLLSDCAGLLDDVVTVIGGLRNLQKLKFELPFITAWCWADFFTSNPEYKNRLSILYLVNDNIDDETVLAISLLPNLVDLSLHEAYLVTQPAWIQFFNSQFMAKIKNLSLSFCDNVDNDVVNVIVQNLRSLESLSLVRCSNISEAFESEVLRKIPATCEYKMY